MTHFDYILFIYFLSILYIKDYVILSFSHFIYKDLSVCYFILLFISSIKLEPFLSELNSVEFEKLFTSVFV